jgi:hypothetical protein
MRGIALQSLTIVTSAVLGPAGMRRALSFERQGIVLSQRLQRITERLLCLDKADFWR